MNTRTRLGTLIASLAFTVQAGIAVAQPVTANAPASTVVLVHGAFADGSSWNKVIPMLQQAGLKVVAVQNPLDSLAGDVAFTKRAIENAEGSEMLVSHSWGGAVITEAGVNDKVHSLVDVAAFAPAEGQSALDTVKGYPQSPGQAFFVKDQTGYVKVSDEGVAKYFAKDLPASEQLLIAATQGALNSHALSEPVKHAAWHDTPSYVVVAGNDAIISPQQQRDQAKRMQAVSVEVPSSHVAMLAYPQHVADLIIQAAK